MRNKQGNTPTEYENKQLEGGGGLLRGDDLVVHGVGAQTQGWIFRHLEAPAS